MDACVFRLAGSVQHKKNEEAIICWPFWFGDFVDRMYAQVMFFGCSEICLISEQEFKDLFCDSITWKLECMVRTTEGE